MTLRLPGRVARRRLSVALSAVVAGALLLGCGDNPTPSTTSSTPSTTSPSSSTSSTATSTTAAVAACSTAVLSASLAPGGSAAGTAYETVTVKNNGPTRCSLSGYPTVTFYAPSAGGGAGAGPKLDVAVQQGGPTPASVTLDPKGAAQFLILYSDVPAGGIGCSTVASARIGLPGSSETLSVPAPMTLCGGSVRVYPLAAPGSESP